MIMIRLTLSPPSPASRAGTYLTYFLGLLTLLERPASWSLRQLHFFPIRAVPDDLMSIESSISRRSMRNVTGDAAKWIV